jgi:hypothetical protein
MGGDRPGVGSKTVRWHTDGPMDRWMKQGWAVGGDCPGVVVAHRWMAQGRPMGGDHPGEGSKMVVVVLALRWTIQNWSVRGRVKKKSW